LSSEQLIAVLAVAVLVMNWFTARDKRDKILCTFRSASRQKQTKWAKIDDIYVRFNHMRFVIIEKCLTYQWYTGGLFGWLNPMRVPTLDYDESSEYPLNPDNLEDTHVITPRTRDLINNRERYGAFAQGINKEVGKKGMGGLTSFIPWIALLAVVVIGFMFYQDHQSNVALFNQVQQIQATLKSLVK